MSLSSLSSELVKNRDQVHEDRRSVGFTFLMGAGLGRTAHRVQQPFRHQHQPAFSLTLEMMPGHGVTMAGPGMSTTPLL